MIVSSVPIYGSSGSTPTMISASELSQLKRILQDHLRSGIVVVIGSGLSCAEGLPSMSGLVTHLKSVAVPSSITASEWGNLLVEISAQGLEAALKKVSISESISTLLRSEIAKVVGAQEEEVVKEVITGNRVLKFSRLLKHLPQDNRFAVVTTNYDRLVELAAETHGFLVDTRSRGSHYAEFSKTGAAYAYCKNVLPIRGGIRKIESKVISLFKPHGSLDWTDHNGVPIKTSFNVGAENALIITPGVSKYRAGYNQPFDMHRELANDAIDKADKLLIIGYGFNDDHLETHLSAKIRSGTQTVMLTYELSDNAKTYLSAYPKSVYGLENGPNTNTTTLYTNNSSYLIQNETLWDTEGFVKGVFEP